jgi:hypothetical protein
MAELGDNAGMEDSARVETPLEEAAEAVRIAAALVEIDRLLGGLQGRIASLLWRRRSTDCWRALTTDWRW